MSQYDIGVIDPTTTSGTVLANRLNGFFGALKSNHSGNSLPLGAVAGQTWLDISNASLWVYRLFDGANFNPIFTLNPASGAVVFSNTIAPGADAQLSQVHSITGDLWSSGWAGNPNYGVVFLNADRNRYLAFDSINYVLPGAGLVLGGNLSLGACTLYTNGDMYMPWALNGLAAVLNGKQPLGTYAGLGANVYGGRQTIQCPDTPLLTYNTSSGATMVHDLRINRGPSTAGYFIRCMTDNDNAAVNDNQFLVRFDGAVIIDGALTQNSADYAEYFEWTEDSVPEAKEAAWGMSVVLVGTKIRPATGADDPEDIIGVVSVTPSIVGDAAQTRWEGAYKRDEMGAFIMKDEKRVYYTEVYFDEIPEQTTDPETGETHVLIRRERKTRDRAVPLADFGDDPLPIGHEIVTERVRVLNPDYDPTQEYIPREERLEWAAIGLLGKLRVRTGQPVGNRWRKMRDINPRVSEYLVR